MVCYSYVLCRYILMQYCVSRKRAYFLSVLIFSGSVAVLVKIDGFNLIFTLFSFFEANK